jgi:AcrR family transcriptional regulator
VASASQVTRGAVYHHFASKQALFEAVLQLQEARATEVIAAAAAVADPWDAAILALNAYLQQCCDPVYGRLVWLEGPAALGWRRWRECERNYAYGLVERFIRDLVDGGYLEGNGFDTLVQFSFWMLGGAGLAVAEAAPLDKPRVRDEWGHLIGQAIGSLRIR